MKLKFRTEQLLLLLPLALVGVSLSRIWGAMPTIMQDEYVYLSQARHLPFEEHWPTNYLFAGTMRLTTLCGTEFYSCTKAINAVVFAVGVMLTFAIAIQFLSFNWSLFAASITAVSPLALQISYFMPETMYFTVMTLVIFAAVKVKDTKKWWLWSLVGFTLGMASLVKPHAIFIIPAILIFALLVNFRSAERSLIRVAGSVIALLIGFMISKLGIGYLFAGTAGLNLFGGYGSPVGVAASVLDSSAMQPSEGAEAAKSNLDVFLEVFPNHLIFHAGFMLLVAGVPLLLSLRLAVQSLITKEPMKHATAYLILIFLIAGTLLFIVPAFEAYVTAGGDDHSDRLILRYYEFLIPQFLIMGLLLPKFAAPKLIWRILQGAIIIAGSIWLAESYSRYFGWKFADSASLPGMAKTSSFLLFAIFVGLAVAYWVEKPDRGALVLGRGAIPIVLAVTLLMSQDTLLERRGDVSVIELAGWETRPFLVDVAGEDIMVVGEVRPNVFATKFWIDKAGIKDLLVVEGGTLTKEYLSGAKHLLLMGNFVVAEPNQELIAGEGYRLVKLLDSP